MHNTKILHLALLSICLGFLSTANARTVSSTMAFNEANAQNMELFQRLWGIHASEGVLDSITPAPASKDCKNPILRQGLENRWSVFVDGNGIFAQVPTYKNQPNINIQGGGVTLVGSYKIDDNFTTGLYAGYEGSVAKNYQSDGSLDSDYQSYFSESQKLVDNAVRFGTFGSYGQKGGAGFYGLGMVGGTCHQYNGSYSYTSQYTSPYGSSSWKGSGNDNYGAGELDAMLAGSYDFKLGNLTFGPFMGMQYTYYGAYDDRDDHQYTYNYNYSYIGNSSGAENYTSTTKGYGTASLPYMLGGHLAYNLQVTRQILLTPQINLCWQHEFLQNPFDLTTSFSDGGSYTNPTRTPLRDTFYTGIGFTAKLGSRWNSSLFYNAAAGNRDLVSQNIFLALGANF
jgi:hypothetical protein